MGVCVKKVSLHFGLKWRIFKIDMLIMLTSLDWHVTTTSQLFLDVFYKMGTYSTYANNTILHSHIIL